MGTTVNTERALGNIRVYATGGCGINLGVQLKEEQKNLEKREDYAKLHTCFLDTSSSNLFRLGKKENVYLIDGLDGSGQVRKKNYEAILPRIKEILQTFKPMDLNLVLTSLSGGSGSVLSVLLTKELLQRGEKVIVLAVGDESSKLYTTNTLNSLKSFESISRQVDKPVVMSYFYNRGSASRESVNKFLLNAVLDLACLFSNQHVGLDSQDLNHFLYYNKVTDHQACLTSISVVLGEEAEATTNSLYSSLGVPITVATLLPAKANSDFPQAIDYHIEGQLDQETSVTLYNGRTVHYVISDGVFDKIVEDLEKRLREINEIKEAKVLRTTILNDDDQVTDDGMVF